jgi:hypothetical protein
MSQYQPLVELEQSNNTLQKGSKLARRIIGGRRSLLRDLRLVLTHAVELPWIVFPLQPEKDSHAELLPTSYPSYVDYLSVIAQMIVPTERKSVSYGTLAVLPPDYVWPQEKRQTNGFLLMVFVPVLPWLY